jgi:hypothetical protein
MVLSSWSIRTKQVGRWLVLYLAIGGLLSQPLLTTSVKELFNGPRPNILVNSRKYVFDQLQSLGGRHVVFVRYGPNHAFHDEWVYNRADVDASTIVWCRWMGPAKDDEVMRYYPDRQFWIVDVGAGLVATRLAHYLR